MLFKETFHLINIKNDICKVLQFPDSLSIDTLFFSDATCNRGCRKGLLKYMHRVISNECSVNAYLRRGSGGA